MNKQKFKVEKITVNPPTPQQHPTNGNDDKLPLEARVKNRMISIVTEYLVLSKAQEVTNRNMYNLLCSANDIILAFNNVPNIVNMSQEDKTFILSSTFKEIYDHEIEESLLKSAIYKTYGDRNGIIPISLKALTIGVSYPEKAIGVDTLIDEMKQFLINGINNIAGDRIEFSNEDRYEYDDNIGDLLEDRIYPNILEALDATQFTIEQKFLFILDAIVMNRISSDYGAVTGKLLRFNVWELCQQPEVHYSTMVAYIHMISDNSCKFATQLVKLNIIANDSYPQVSSLYDTTYYKSIPTITQYTVLYMGYTIMVWGGFDDMENTSVLDGILQKMIGCKYNFTDNLFCDFCTPQRYSSGTYTLGDVFSITINKTCMATRTHDNGDHPDSDIGVIRGGANLNLLLPTFHIINTEVLSHGRSNKRAFRTVSTWDVMHYTDFINKLVDISIKGNNHHQAKFSEVLLNSLIYNYQVCGVADSKANISRVLDIGTVLGSKKVLSLYLYLKNNNDLLTINTLFGANNTSEELKCTTISGIDNRFLCMLIIHELAKVSTSELTLGTHMGNLTNLCTFLYELPCTECILLVLECILDPSVKNTRYRNNVEFALEKLNPHELSELYCACKSKEVFKRAVMKRL